MSIRRQSDRGWPLRRPHCPLLATACGGDDQSPMNQNIRMRDAGTARDATFPPPKGHDDEFNDGPDVDATPADPTNDAMPPDPTPTDANPADSPGCRPLDLLMLVQSSSALTKPGLDDLPIWFTIAERLQDFLLLGQSLDMGAGLEYSVVKAASQARHPARQATTRRSTFPSRRFAAMAR